MSSRLDPLEALGGPLYALSGALFMLPLTDFLLGLPPAEFSSVDWRFNAAGLLSEHVLLPIVGIAFAFVVAVVLKQHVVQRGLVILCLTSAVILLFVSWRLMLDAPQVIAAAPADEHKALESARTRALLTNGASAWLLAYLGLRARRMIRAPSRPRGPRPVHVVSK